MEKTIHNVVIDLNGIPTPFNIGKMTQGSKNVDIIRIKFESYKTSTDLVGILKATRGDGEKAPAGLLLVPNEIDGVVYYDYEIGKDEIENEGIGSWFTKIDENITFSVALIKDDSIKIQSSFEMMVETTAGFDEDAEYTFDIIEGFLQALSMRATYDYVDNINDTLFALIETNQLDIVDLNNNKIDKDIISNLTTETNAEKEDYMIIQNFNENEVKRIKLEDIKDLVTKVKSVNNIEPDTGTTNITLVAENINSDDGNLQTDINFSKSEDIRIENKFNEEVERIDDDLENAVYIDDQQLEEPFPTTYANALKLNNKEESELDVNSAGNVRDTINDVPISNIFETDKTTVKNAAKVYNKTESELKEAMQDGLMERTLLLEDIITDAVPLPQPDYSTDYFTLPNGITIQNGDVLEIVIDTETLYETNEKSTFLYMSGIKESGMSQTSDAYIPTTTTKKNITIGTDTIYHRVLNFRYIKFGWITTHPFGDSVQDNTLRVWGGRTFRIGELALSSNDFYTNSALTIKKVYLWRKKELS